MSYANYAPFFEFVENGKGDCRIFKCTTCKPSKKLAASKSSLSNLRKHIKFVHHTLLPAYNKAVGKRKSFEKQTTPLKLRCESPKKENNNDAIFKFIVNTGSPISFLEDQAFKDYNKEFGVVSTMTREIFDNLLSDNMINMAKDLKRTFAEISAICLTADCWSACERSFLGITAQWLDPLTLKRQSAGLACRRIIGSISYDDLAQVIDDTMKEYNIKNKVSVIVTDNGSKFVKGNRDADNTEGHDIQTIEITELLESKKDSLLPPHHRCAVHSLNLICIQDVLDANENADYSNIFKRVSEKCETLWTKQSHSTPDADIIHSNLDTNLLIPVDTSWNSFYEAMLSIKEHMDTQNLNKHLNILELNGFNQEETKFIDEYCKIMNVMSRAIDTLQRDDGKYLGFLLPTIKAIEVNLTLMQDTLLSCKCLVDCILKGLETRFGHIFKMDEYCLAASLLPKFKLSWVDDPESLSTLLKATMKQIEDEETTKESSRDDFFPFSHNIENKLYNLYMSMKETVKLDDMPSELRSVFIKFNTGMNSSAHVGRLLSLGGTFFENMSGILADKDFENLLLLKLNKFLK